MEEDWSIEQGFPYNLQFDCFSLEIDRSNFLEQGE